MTLKAKIGRIRAAMSGQTPGPYTPTSADMEYRNADREMGLFDEARLLRHVSHEYLAVLAHDNAGPASGAMKALIDAEVSRRGFAAARRANAIAIFSAIVAGLALLVSLFK